jgi:hypothetical protein
VQNAVFEEGAVTGLRIKQNQVRQVIDPPEANIREDLD